MQTIIIKEVFRLLSLPKIVIFVSHPLLGIGLRPALAIYNIHTLPNRTYVDVHKNDLLLSYDAYHVNITPINEITL